MKDELITLETGKLAKEKGFNIPVLWYYIGDSAIFRWDEDSDHNARSNRVSIPTQSLLQRWLRETHKNQIDIMPGIECIMPDLDTYYAYTITTDMFIASEDTYNTYEKALEAALKHLLSLIS